MIIVQPQKNENAKKEWRSMDNIKSVLDKSRRRQVTKQCVQFNHYFIFQNGAYMHTKRLEKHFKLLRRVLSFLHVSSEFSWAVYISYT